MILSVQEQQHHLILTSPEVIETFHTHQMVEVCQQRCSSLIARKKQAEVVLCFVWWRTLLVPKGPCKAEAQLLVYQHHRLHWALGQERWVCGCFFSPIRSSPFLFQCWLHQNICKVLNSNKTIHQVTISRKWRGGEWTVKRTVTLRLTNRMLTQPQSLSRYLFMQWEELPELQLLFLLLTQGCPAAPAPVSVQATLLFCLLLSYALLLIPLIDDLLKREMGRRRKHS